MHVSYFLCYTFRRGQNAAETAQDIWRGCGHGSNANVKCRLLKSSLPNLKTVFGTYNRFTLTSSEFEGKWLAVN